MRHLGDEDGGHGLVQRGPVHVDGGADWEHEPTETDSHLSANVYHRESV